MQVVVIASLFLAVLCSGIVQEWQGPPPVWLGGWLEPDRMPLASAGLLTGLLAFHFSFTRYSMLHVRKAIFAKDEATRIRADRLLVLQRRLLPILFLCMLTVGGWCWTVLDIWQLSRWVGLWEIALAAPFVLLLTIHWLGYYPVQRAMREQLMMLQLSSGAAVHPAWSLPRYLGFQLRHSLLVIALPSWCIFVWNDAVLWLSQHTDLLPQNDALLLGLTFVGAITVFLISPFLLRWIWSVRPLPDGPLRQQLQTLAQRLNVHYRDLLVWDSQGSVINAAVMGLLGPFRYVVISDGLIENFDDDQISLVFAHEAGHIRHRHGLFIMMLLLGSVLALAGSMELLAQLAAKGAPLSNLPAPPDLLVGGLFVLGWLPLLGWTLSRFERQADAYAVSHSPSQNGDVQHVEAARHRAAHRLGMTLKQIARLNGIEPHRRTWGYGTLRQRLYDMYRYGSSAACRSRFDKSIGHIKMAITLIGCLGIGLLSWALWLGSHVNS